MLETKPALLHLPDDAAYDLGRSAWNLSADQRPFAVAMPATAADVQAVLAFAAEAGHVVVPQGPGHNPHAIASLDGAILLRTALLDEVEVDPATRTARVGAGALVGDLASAAAEHGLAPISGSTGDVSVVGFALGGGIGWLSRALGIAAESVLAFEVALPDGRLVRASAHEEPDLFWALRGGGGSFGVITAMEVRLHEVATVYAGMLLWPDDRLAEVAHAWHRWTRTAPEAATTSLRRLSFPPLPELPPFLSGRQLVVIDGAILGDEAAAAELLAPLRALAPEMDTFATSPATVLPMIHMDPPEPTPAISAHAMLRELTTEAVDAFVAASVDPLLIAELRHLGGAISRPPAGAGALGGLDAEYLWFACGIPMDPEVVAALHAAFAGMEAALAPWRAERVYANFAERVTTTDEIFDRATAERLRDLKRRYDPAGLLQPGHAVR